MAEITVTLGTLDKLIQHLDDYEKRLNDQIKQYLERLAQVGIEDATQNFEDALYDGVNDVVVRPQAVWEDDGKTLKIVAEGQAIAFIEFGAGDWNPGVHPKADELGAIRGAYGQGKGSSANNPWKKWGFYGDDTMIGTPDGKLVTNSSGNWIVVTKGNDPNYCMWDASKKMEEEAERIAREVFKL